MPVQKNNISTSFSFLLSCGILFLNQVNASVNLNHRRLPCETACITNDDEDQPKFGRTAGIVTAALFGTAFIVVCLCNCCPCSNSTVRRTPLRTPLLQNTVFQEPPQPQTHNIELPSSPPASTYGEEHIDEADDGFSARIV